MKTFTIFVFDTVLCYILSHSLCKYKYERDVEVLSAEQFSPWVSFTHGAVLLLTDTWFSTDGMWKSNWHRWCKKNGGDLKPSETVRNKRSTSLVQSVKYTYPTPVISAICSIMLQFCTVCSISILKFSKLW